MNQERMIHLYGPLGQRQLREVLGTQLAGLMLYPETIWLVSPYVSDFPVLDNRAGHWDALDPSWGNRELGFNELLARVVNGGCPLCFVTKRGEPSSEKFLNNLRGRLLPGADLKVLLLDDVHTKVLLTHYFMLEGSMNFTFSGTHVKKENVTLTLNRNKIAGLLALFEQDYCFEGQVG